jgi:hypothetical protein
VVCPSAGIFQSATRPVANLHTPEQQSFIVRKLAAFEPPRSIVIDFAAVYPGTKCDENDVRRLDPTTAIIAPDLHSLFLTTREAAMLDPKSAPFAEKKARLIALSQHAKFYSGNNQLGEMRAVLRQIAEETGAIGAKGKAAAAADEGEVPITKITRTIVDPKSEEKPDEQQE